MSRPGDWNCGSCHYLNFQRRDSCQRCGEPRLGDRYGGFGGRGSGYSSPFPFATGPDVRPGDWYCSIADCGTHNFASRSTCFRCGALRDSDSSTGGSEGGGEMHRMRGSRFASGGGGGGGRAGWRSGDWICTRLGCNEHNFASRTECFRCNAPRESPGRSAYSSS